MSEQEKWREEAKSHQKTIYLYAESQCAFEEGFIQGRRKGQKEIERLKEGLDHPPFHSYSEALREGCDPDRAWECFKEDYRRHVKTVFGETK